MELKPELLSRKLKIIYFPDSESKSLKLTLANLDANATGEQIGQVVEALQTLFTYKFDDPEIEQSYVCPLPEN